MKSLTDRITVDPTMMVGKPTIRGLRITVEQILKALAAGRTTKDILEDFPELETADIQASFRNATSRCSDSSDGRSPRRRKNRSVDASL